mgnify:CR=1
MIKCYWNSDSIFEQVLEKWQSKSYPELNKIDNISTVKMHHYYTVHY